MRNVSSIFKKKIIMSKVTTPLEPRAASSAKKDFEHFILEEDHPCIMAQTVFSLDKVDFHQYDTFGSRETAKEMLADLKNYIAAYDFESNDFLTFLAGFGGKQEYSEEEFERLLWQQLQYLHEEDEADWDEAVSADPESKNFSFSLGGKAFYIVGLHPNSSRKARQAPFPAVAFNLHWQFEKLREMNSYHKVRDKIRERDAELQGSMNPMLEDFGESSEAKQYSGRQVDESWKCPFHSKKKT